MSAAVNGVREGLAPRAISGSNSELLQALVDGSPDGLILLGPDRAVLVANRAARAMLGARLDLEPGADTAHQVLDGLVVDLAAGSEGPVHRLWALPDGRQILVTAGGSASRSGAGFTVVALRDLGALAPALSPGSVASARGATGPGERGADRESQPTELVARSLAMGAALAKARQYAGIDSPVLLLGETGTGKRAVARAIHESSARRGGPFVEVDLPALPEALLDVELFGGVAGERPGDQGNRVGLLEQAHGGTLLLHDVGRLPAALQIKLLRFLDDGEVWPSGAVEPGRSDVRILATSSADLSRLVSDGRFRGDLYFRLNVLSLPLPPLRERREDVPGLIDMMVAHLARHRGRVRMISPGAVEVIARCPFPGNVRELWNLLEHLVVACPREVIAIEDLPSELRALAGRTGDGERRISLRKTLRGIEAQMIRDALLQYGTQTEAAKHLGVTQSTVARKAKQYGLGRRAE